MIPQAGLNPNAVLTVFLGYPKILPSLTNDVGNDLAKSKVNNDFRLPYLN